MKQTFRGAVRTATLVADFIKGFNREWAAITSMRIAGQRVGWKLETACGTERRFPDNHWDDPYGAAMHALESHRCNAG